ncbi:hypothetical protein RclHR1_10160005 [Rhizophagus clarus]|uniref:Uncharacterized protein n=1 Tax=Rhizophagus clarus TaxID=94130 RepID=A0A2Z6QSW9_9GLOM|nr:hypothetical protein RclHR1_10160005 [Rhizophagus clarus]
MNVEVVQLAEVNKDQQQVNQHPEDWNYLFGYTDNLFIIIVRIYYWIIILVSFGILGWALDSFDRRWKDIQYYSDNSKNIFESYIILPSPLAVPSIILLASSNKLRTCTASSYPYKVPERLLHQCNAYLASLLLAYILIFTVIVQLLFSLVVVKHQKEISRKPPPNLQGPKKIKVRRSKRVAKKKGSKRSSAAFSMNSTKLSIVTEDDEERSNRSIRSSRSRGSDRSANDVQNEFNSEMEVNSNV